MKNNMKLILPTAAIMTLALAGCGPKAVTAKSLLETAQTNLKNIHSYEGNLTMNLVMNYNDSGDDADDGATETETAAATETETEASEDTIVMAVTATTDIEATTSPVASHVKTSFNSSGMTFDSEVYTVPAEISAEPDETDTSETGDAAETDTETAATETDATKADTADTDATDDATGESDETSSEEENDYLIYTNVMDTWIMQSGTATQAESYDASKTLSALLTNPDVLTLADGTSKTEDGKEIYVITAAISGDVMNDLMSSGNSLLTETTGLDNDSVDYSNLSATIEYGIYKDTILPAYINMSISGYDELMANMGAEGYSCPTFELNQAFSAYDTIDTITVPDDVLATAIDYDDFLDVDDSDIEYDITEDNLPEANDDGSYTLVSYDDLDVSCNITLPEGVSLSEGSNVNSFNFNYDENDEDYGDFFIMKDEELTDNGALNYLQSEFDYATDYEYENAKLGEEKTYTINGHTVKANYFTYDYGDSSYVEYGFSMDLGNGYCLQTQLTQYRDLGKTEVKLDDTVNALLGGVK